MKLSLKRRSKRRWTANAEYLMKVMEGWNLDVEFSKDAVQQMCNEYPGAALALIDAYRLSDHRGPLRKLIGAGAAFYQRGAGDKFFQCIHRRHRARKAAVDI